MNAWIEGGMITALQHSKAPVAQFIWKMAGGGPGFRSGRLPFGLRLSKAARRADPREFCCGAPQVRSVTRTSSGWRSIRHGTAKGRCASDRRGAAASGHHQARRVRRAQPCAAAPELSAPSAPPSWSAAKSHAHQFKRARLTPNSCGRDLAGSSATSAQGGWRCGAGSSLPTARSGAAGAQPGSASARGPKICLSPLAWSVSTVVQRVGPSLSELGPLVDQ